MPSLRKLIDGQITAARGKAEQAPMKAGDQVVVKRLLGRGGPRTSEVVVGTIAAMAPNGQAVVTLPRPGGRVLRSTVDMSSLTPVSDVYKRNAVQANPAFRAIYRGV